MSSSESSWPDEVWLDPIRDHVRRRAQRSPGGAESTWGGSSVSGSSVDQMRHEIRNLRFYVPDSDESRRYASALLLIRSHVEVAIDFPC
jgi:hypothetical protein